jgi:hypothetical protein
MELKNHLALTLLYQNVHISQISLSQNILVSSPQKHYPVSCSTWFLTFPSRRPAIGPPCFVSLLTRAEYFRFGPVLDQNKQPNRFYFFLFWNRTEPKTGSNRLILVRFGSGFFPSKPVQTEITPVEFFLGFLSTTFFNTSVLYLLPFSRKSTSIFVLIDPCPEVKPSKKIHKTKQKRYPWL